MAGKLRAYFRRVESKRAKRMRTTMSTQTTRVIHVYGYGGPEQLKLEQKPRPEPQAGEELVRVHAAGGRHNDLEKPSGVVKEFPAGGVSYNTCVAVGGRV